ncbi:MAG TPA: cell division protein ZapE [Rudaea sp.]
MTGDTTTTALYERGIADRKWENDPAQRDVLARLDRVRAEVVAAERAGWWRRTFAHPAPVRGLYIWGAVGRGKTFCVDLFFAALPIERKLRVHFHRFMGRVHAELAQLEGHSDPLRDVARHFARQARVLCLDEFFVTDIADAMILANLLQHLFEDGVTLVTTSNIEPAQLYRDGLQRAKFLPAIDLLRSHCEIVELVSEQDYRLRTLRQAGVYFTPLGENAERALARCFDQIARGARRGEAQIRVNGRPIAMKQRADGVIWFDFDAICDGPRAVADYIEIGQSFNTVLISGVPQFTPRMEDQARRFVHLVDEFYDRGVKLVLSAATPIIDLYDGERLRAEFARTQSRLIEMQSAEYLARAHRH